MLIKINHQNCGFGDGRPLGDPSILLGERLTLFLPLVGGLIVSSRLSSYS